MKAGRKESNKLYRKAQTLMPGGVNSPVRAFSSVHDTPFFVKRAKGAYLYDVDGNEYLDYVASWGAIILGHAADGLVEEIKTALEEGTSFGACHPMEVEMARIITSAFQSMETLRLVSSGTEATMSAIRLARGYTGKRGVIKFRGCYHGHADSLLVKAGSGLATFGTPDSAGILADLAKHTYVADFNHLESVKQAVSEHKDDVACVILEPVMGNMGVILPQKAFLKGVEEICRENRILLICDEVITGFRVVYGGVQHLYDIVPDLTCLGKIIGGGFPIGAFGGRREIMDRLAPLGDVYQAGTLSGNPIAVRAGVFVLKYLKKYLPYGLLRDRVESLREMVIELAVKSGIHYRINGLAGMFTGFFSREEVWDYETAVKSDRALYELFFKLMREEGIFFAPSPFEASFLTLEHGEKEFARTVDAYDKVFIKLRKRQIL
ncbi:MAG: glutamate-1-semialdehyde 2,1-aminomutase [Syntrophobacterales bacterium]|jgi:glutamate-1-semialdehyde 2,1-aminomutase|nr:glutamate-1-semialdehyde 2,1-aminomutase [Syntrophobacterales bacterium]